MFNNKAMDSGAQPALPSLATLGKDLLLVSRLDLALSFFRPALCFVLYWVFALTHHYVLAAASVAALMFFTYTSTSHDLVHRTLHLPEFWNELSLFALEAICLRSGHSFRLSHLQHHKYFPHETDVEGADAAKSFWSALSCGPTLQVRLFLWAWRRGNAAERRWMLVEGAFIVAALLGAALLWKKLPELLAYTVLVILASWIFPLATVWWPHHAAGPTPLQQTRCFRGRILPLLFFQHTYHLEHHLYPGVSSHHWSELGRRLEPFLASAGVKFVRVP